MTFREKIAMPIVVLLAAFTVSFFAYGGGRTMVEHIGTSQRGIINGITVSGLSIIGLVVVIWFYFLFKRPAYIQRVLPLAIVALLLGSVGGAVVSEVLITRDEESFPAEISAITSEPDAEGNEVEEYSRPRAWPNGSGQLNWSKERGTWAVD